MIVTQILILIVRSADPSQEIKAKARIKLQLDRKNEDLRHLRDSFDISLKINKNGPISKFRSPSFTDNKLYSFSIQTQENQENNRNIFNEPLKGNLNIDINDQSAKQISINTIKKIRPIGDRDKNNSMKLAQPHLAEINTGPKIMFLIFIFF